METEFVEIKEGIQKKIIVQGEGEEVQDKCRCKVFVRGYLEDGKEFENNLNDTMPKKLTVESDFNGLNMALKGMKKGEKALIKVPSKYGFGEEGDQEKGVPANATLFYEVELVSFKGPKKQRWDMNEEEKAQKAQKLRVKGTKKFKEGSFKDAKKFYKDGLQYCNTDNQEGKELKASLYLNLSICCFQLHDFKDSIDNAKKAIDLDTNNEQKLKGYYRIAQAYEKIGELEKAETELKEALKIDEKNAVIIEELHKIKQLNREAKLKEKEAFSKLFTQKLYDDEEINPKKVEKIREVKSDDETSLSDKNEKIEEENENKQKDQEVCTTAEPKIEQESEKKIEEIDIQEQTTTTA